MSDAATTAENRTEIIRHLAGLLSRDREVSGLSPGEHAELRRTDPAGVLPPIMWRMLTQPNLAGLLAASSGGRHAAESAWALLIRTMAEADVPGQSRPVGQALADPSGAHEPDTSYAEMRFVRLLRARTFAAVAYEARQAARWCALKGAAIRFEDEGRRPNGFGPFILAAALNREGELDHRARAIARDYFACLPRATES